MQTTLARPPDVGNTLAPETDAEDAKEPTALEILADSRWVVLIPRGLVERFNTPSQFGALVAWTAATAWRDRGVPGKPPGGWPAMVGVSRQNWHRWRALAIEHGLIGATKDGRIAPLAQLGEGEQFARVPVSVLFDPKLSRPARRVFVALTLYRSGTGWSRAAIGTLAERASVDRRAAKRALRELERRLAIVATGMTDRGVWKFLIPGARRSVTLEPPPLAQSVTLEPPPLAQSVTLEPPEVSRENPPFKRFKSKELQEGRATLALSAAPSPRGKEDEQNQNTFGIGELPFDGSSARLCHEGAQPVHAVTLGAICNEPKKSGLQGKRATEPPCARWRTMTDHAARDFYSGWSISRFEAAKRSAEEALGHASDAEAATLRDQIADFSDHLERMAA